MTRGGARKGTGAPRKPPEAKAAHRRMAHLDDATDALLSRLVVERRSTVSRVLADGVRALADATKDG